MKNLLLVLLLAGMGNLCAQNNLIANFCEDCNGDDAFYIHLESDILDLKIEDDNGKRRVVVEEVYFLATEDKGKSCTMKSSALLQQLKTKGFEEHATVKEKDGAVTFWIKEKKGKVKNLVVIARSKDGLVLIGINGVFDKQDLDKLDLGIGDEQLKHLKRA